MRRTSSSSSAWCSAGAKVPTDPLVLSDPARHEVPVTLLMGGMSAEELHGMLGQWQPWLDALTAISDAEVVKLGTGHWPQFSKPDALAQAMLAIDPHADAIELALLRTYKRSGRAAAAAEQYAHYASSLRQDLGAEPPAFDEL